jgi:hypothetical protein
MPAVFTDVLGKPAPPCQEVNVMAGHDTNGWVADLLQIRRTRRFVATAVWVSRRAFRLVDRFQEGMPTMTRVLLETVTGRDVTNAMAKETAQIPNLLLEPRRGAIRVVCGIEQQRMPALRADIFVTAVPIGELFVIVLAEEARQGVPDPCRRPILSQVIGSTPAPPVVAPCLLEDMVIDVMPPQRARQFRQTAPHSAP